ncbi:hypothetical protein KC19_4G024600 [Ceratodon purpureus]|uniref:Uncharacterized protein n=1 Tax=Ceratodon purpureus TaxID=3225 RepID=A0A8T0I623_CERPU|nr:hypothetical protein KC19_4G024200 [Ceratodon purpureus]KAG0578459.1 hypothetical protein KC19_4G024600 [Ceratodon purpureus]
MEALAVLRLSVSPRRNNDAHAALEDAEEIALPTPYTSPPSSPRHAFTMDVEESPLGEVRAAIPFVWELIPGTPKDDFEMQTVDVGVIFDMSEETGSEGHGSSRSSEDDSESLSRDSSKIEFEFCTRFEGIVEPSLAMSTADELLSNGQVVPLRLPPRLQGVKHLRSSDSSCSDISSNGSSFKSCHSPQSPQSPHVLNVGSKLTLCGLMRTLESEPEEVTILGMQERKQKIRSLSPLRFLSMERSNLSSEAYFSRDSVSSASSFSSSSSRAETTVDSPQALWDSPDGKRNKGRTLNDLVPDMPIASRGTEGVKVSSSKETTHDVAKPRLVESGRQLLKKHQDNGSPAAEKIDVISQLSPSYASSRLSSSPSVDMHFKTSKREQLGRALFGSRFGTFCSCLGIPPDSH